MSEISIIGMPLASSGASTDGKRTLESVDLGKNDISPIGVMAVAKDHCRSPCERIAIAGDTNCCVGATGVGNRGQNLLGPIDAYTPSAELFI